MSKTNKTPNPQQRTRKPRSGHRRFKVEQVYRRESEPVRRWKSGLEWRIKDDD
jgi:hypothetical protein